MGRRRRKQAAERQKTRAEKRAEQVQGLTLDHAKGYLAEHLRSLKEAQQHADPGLLRQRRA